MPLAFHDGVKVKAGKPVREADPSPCLEARCPGRASPQLPLQEVDLTAFPVETRLRLAQLPPKCAELLSSILGETWDG